MLNSEEKQILKALNVLLVDDDRHIISISYPVFTALFNQVFIAHNVAAGIELYRQHAIDLIISDIRMNGMDGLAMVRVLREQNDNVPVIILSAYSDQDYLFSAIELDITAYLTKPINMKKLTQALDKVITHFQRRDPEMLIAENARYHFLKKTLKIDGQVINLGRKERQLFELFIKYQNTTLSKEFIMSTIWPNSEVTESAFKNLLFELRKKLPENAIKTYPHAGWAINDFDY